MDELLRKLKQERKELLDAQEYGDLHEYIDSSHEYLADYLSQMIGLLEQEEKKAA